VSRNPKGIESVAAHTLDNQNHIFRSLWFVLLGSLALGILFSLCWVTAAYGRLGLAADIVRWVTATRGNGMTVLYHGLLYSLVVGGAAGAVVALLDRALVWRRSKSAPQ
jgi:hypothetical protein